MSEPRGGRSADDYDRIFKDTVQNYTSIANGASGLTTLYFLLKQVVEELFIKIDLAQQLH